MSGQDEDPPKEILMNRNDVQTENGINAVWTTFEEREKRKSETWGKQIDFLLSCIGYSVGLTSFWRFPYLCMRNGGGAFMIPYIVCLILCGMPLYILEVAIGQFSALGPLKVWNVSPLFKGIGWGMLILSGLVAIYYNLIITWVLYFLFSSFSYPLPWATCDNEWNTENCFDRSKSDVNLTRNILNVTSRPFGSNMTSSLKSMTSAEEFWQLQALQLSPGIDQLGSMRWPLFACLLISWIVVFLCLFRGVKWSGKVVYVTATAPYLFLTFLLIRGCMLPGASQGIVYYLKPDFHQLFNIKVWAEACLQVFYSLGPAWGGLIAMSSHNKYHNNCLRDSLIVPLVCWFSSFYCGFVCFSIVGHMAHTTGTNVRDVITSGPGLTFSSYPEAIARLPLSPLWAILFFLMVLFLGIDSQFGMMETCTSGLMDEFPGAFKKKFKVIGFICLTNCLLGIPLVTQGGMYLFQIIDWYAAAFSSMTIAFFECVVMAYAYGADRLFDNMESMLGKRPSKWWKVCWCAITPAIMLALLINSGLQMVPPTYGSYEYPRWSIVLGWMLALCSMLPIPLYAIIALLRERGSFVERIKRLMKPSEIWYENSRLEGCTFRD